jgi:hypothetical protein
LGGNLQNIRREINGYNIAGKVTRYFFLIFYFGFAITSMSDEIIYESRLGLGQIMFRMLASSFFTLVFVFWCSIFFKLQNEHNGFDTVPGYFLGLFLPACGLIGLYILYFRITKIKVDSHNLYVGRRTISFPEIQGFNISIQEAFIEVILKSGESLNLPILKYYNRNILIGICEKLQENIANGIYSLGEFETSSNKTYISANSLRDQNFTVFKFNPLYSINFYYPLAIAFIPIFFFLKDPSKGFIFDWYWLGLMILLFGGFAFRYNYFLVSRNYVVVKNHLYIWQRSIIPTKSIRSVYTETDLGRIRIIKLVFVLSDYKTKEFSTNVTSEDGLNDLVAKINEYINKQ